MSILTNQEVLSRFSNQLQQLRIQQNFTQEEVAARAGVNINTLRKLESGKNSSLLTLIAILRVLQFENKLLEILPNSTISPMAALKNKNKIRKRVRKAGTK